MIVLGLDPSLSGFGWCVHNSSVLGPARVVAKGVLTTTSKTLFISRYRFLRDKVMELIEKYPEVEAVGVESPPYGESFSEGLYGLYLYVNEALYLKRKDVVFFDPKTLKMLAKMDPTVRRGTMDKRDMIEAMRAETQIKRINHNEADAYIVAREAARFWELYHGLIQENELTPSEVRSFTRIHKVTKGPRAGRVSKLGLLFREDDRFFRFSQLEE